MGRTIPSYRIASDMERWKWSPFRKLLDKEDRKIFEVNNEFKTLCLVRIIGYSLN
jgi:hypothetical protein